VNILLEKPDKENECDFVCFAFYSPGDMESTGETTGGAVGKRNRNIVTNDQLNNLRCKRGLVEMIVIVYVLFFLFTR